MTKRRKTIAKPIGRGYIPMTEGQSVNVRYHLVVIRTVDDAVDTGELAGQTEINGTIEVGRGQGMIDLAGKHFMLNLNDHRCLKVLAKKGDPVTRQWEIVATGPTGLHPC